VDRDNSTWTRRAVLAAALTGVGTALAAPAATAAQPRRVLAGAYVPDPYWDPEGWPAALDAYNARAGSAPTIVHWFAAWDGEPPFPSSTAALVTARGQVPLLTWEPWDWQAGADQPQYRLSQITGGRYDAYVRRFALAARAFARPVYLRFAPEMNGDWNTWSELCNGNRPGDYVRAWRHVRAIFNQVGARNVRWVWTPIVGYDGSTPLRRLFPGDRDVDVVGVDGYNWGATKSHLGWQSYSQVFGPTLTQVRSLSAKPLWIAEVGCTEQGGDKAAWVSDMFARVCADPRVDAVVWFNADKETDWRINSSPAALAAFQGGLAGLSGAVQDSRRGTSRSRATPRKTRVTAATT